MPKDRSEVVEALKQGALSSGSEYVTVRREDLLIALGAEPQKPRPQEVDKDKKPA
jgi:hypothetical protein